MVCVCERERERERERWQCEADQIHLFRTSHIIRKKLLKAISYNLRCFFICLRKNKLNLAKLGIHFQNIIKLFLISFLIGWPSNFIIIQSVSYPLINLEYIMQDTAFIVVTNNNIYKTKTKKLP